MAFSVFSFRMKSVRLSPVSSLNLRERYGRLRNSSSAIFSAVMGSDKWYPTAKRTGLHGEDKRYLSNYGQAYGEWAEPESVHHMTWKDCAVPHPEVATAYTAHVMDCMAEMESALGNEAESKA